MTYAALTFNPIGDPNTPSRWTGQQIDGELVGSISRYGPNSYCVAMMDTRGSLCTVGMRTKPASARHLLTRAWQLQLSKGGNP